MGFDLKILNYFGHTIINRVLIFLSIIDIDYQIVGIDGRRRMPFRS